MQANVSLFMHIGPKATQEDCVLLGSETIQSEETTIARRLEDERLLLVVCDGVGGHEAGEEASRFACDFLLTCLNNRTLTPENLEIILEQMQNEACRKLPKESGSTVVGLLLTPNQATIFNIGDSRAYTLVSNIKKISKDHSFVQRLVDKKLISETDAFDHPYKNIVNLGVGPVFSEQWEKEKPYISTLSFDAPTSFLLCTDGLTDLYTDTQISQCVNASDISQFQAITSMLDLDKFKDNTTFIVCEVQP